jgi:protein gp37
VSAGCKHCFAQALVNGRMKGDFSKRVRASAHTFAAPLRWNKNPWVCDECGDVSSGEGIEEICPSCGSQDRHRRRVFLGSLMDWLDPDVPVEWLADALDIVRRCPDLVFQLVTKRPERFLDRLNVVSALASLATESQRPDLFWWVTGWMEWKAVPSNVHVIVSVEDQASADERIPHLLSIPAVVRGLSVEPILERIDLSYDIGTGEGHRGTLLDGIGWVIVGGESGPNRREAEGGTVEAVTDIVRQCREAGVPCLVKQDCAARPGQQGRLTDEVWDVKQFPK